MHKLLHISGVGAVRLLTTPIKKAARVRWLSEWTAEGLERYEWTRRSFMRNAHLNEVSGGLKGGTAS